MTTPAAAAPAAPPVATNTPATPPLGIDPNTPPVTPPATPPAGDGTPPALDIGDPTKPEEGTPPASSEVEFEYAPTGDAGLDLALEFVGKLGYGPQHEAIVAAQKGDFSVLEAALKAQGDKAKGYDRFLTLAKQSFERGTEKAKSAEAETRKVVYEAAGGEKAWNDIQAWAAANADPEEKEQINAMLKAGGLQARLAVQGLAQLYNAQLQTKPPAAALKPGASTTPASAGALTAAEYAREVQSLRAKLGASFDTSPDYAALQARRRASR